MKCEQRELGISRRSFLDRSVTCSFGIATLATSACTLQPSAGPVAMATSSSAAPEVFDFHTHLHFLGKAGDQVWAENAASSRVAGLIGGFFSVVPDIAAIGMTRTGPAPKRDLESGEAWQAYRSQLSRLRQVTRDTSIKLETGAGALTNSPDDIIAAYISCEGAHFLDGKIERLEEVYQDGVRSLQLVHYVPNEIGDYQTGETRFGGLSDFGKAVVKEASRLGMVIDVAHATFETARDVAELIAQPIISSHTILDGETIPDGLKKRAVSRDYAKLIADTGGVIGAWPVTRTMEEYLAVREGKPVDMSAVHRDVLDLVEVIGADHVGLGTDFAGGPIVLSDYAQLDDWSSGLAASALTTEELAKVYSHNAQRILREVVV